MGPIATILAKQKSAEAAPPYRTEKVVFVRMEAATHARLKNLASDQKTSLNRLCNAALEAALAELEVTPQTP